MSQTVHRKRVLHTIRTAASTFRVTDWTLNQIDPDGLRHVFPMGHPSAACASSAPVFVVLSFRVRAETSNTTQYLAPGRRTEPSGAESV